ncbi:MAG: hypothetical protein DRO13_00850 [Thermoprotei archaeon]|nr:MAG: hypothetical protein DRO13_00850 [Thermoprotei archaeon]
MVLIQTKRSPLFPFFTLHAKALDADDLSIAIARARSMCMYILAFFIILGGFLTDYFRRVEIIVLGATIITTIHYCYAFVTEWLQLAILWVID